MASRFVRSAKRNRKLAGVTVADDPFADHEAQLSEEMPLDAWIYVRVDDDTLTAFSVDAGETLEVFALTDKPAAALDR